MRAAKLPLLALPLALLTYCGSNQDLILGEVAAVTDSGSGGTALSGTGAELTLGGTSLGAASGVGGSVSEAGTTDGGTEGGSIGAGGASGDDCEVGEDVLPDSLLHRYSFDGTGANTYDSIGAQDGDLVGGAMLNGSGMLSLPGGYPP